jgi:hypothetical protein
LTVIFPGPLAAQGPEKNLLLKNVLRIEAPCRRCYISRNDFHLVAGRRQRPPWAVLAAGPTAATTEVEGVDGRPLRVLSGFPVATTTDVGDVDGGGPWGVVGISDIGHH